jgi:putative phosphoribosyl transferase
MRFQNRTHAGQLLAAQLTAYANQPCVRVLALPRGGVPVAFEIAQALRAPLDVWVVRKIGAPEIPEFALGAIAPGGIGRAAIELIDEASVAHTHTTPQQLHEILARERAELERREQAYRRDRLPIDVAGCTVMLVDDGLATGSTMRAAIAALRQRNPARIVVAVPVAASSVCQWLSQQADQVVCLFTPAWLDSVGQWYDDFSQTTDTEVCELLRQAADTGASQAT